MSLVMVVNNFEEARQSNNELRKRILTVCGMYVQGQAKLNCPVDTGRLRSSIEYTVNNNSVSVGTNVEYAINVHESSRGRSPRRFLHDSAMQGIREIKTIAENETRRFFA